MEELTKLSLQVGENIVTWETPHTDCSAEEVLQGLFGVMVAQTWFPSSILSGMRAIVAEHSGIIGNND